jgi:urease accessory protein
MRKITRKLDSPARLARSLVARAPALTLRFDDRRRSRLAATLDNGEAVGLLLPRGTVLADGDVLVAEDGNLVRVIAAAEEVMRVSAAHALTLARAAYHLGNRHTPVEIRDAWLQIEVDPVLEAMLRGLGARVERVTAPFTPEAGAYGGGHRHGHDETFAEDYALAQQVYAQRHADDHGHGHAHDPDHGHGHDHDHAHDYRPERVHPEDSPQPAQGRAHAHEHPRAHEHGHSHAHEHPGAHAHPDGDERPGAPGRSAAPDDVQR